jgi:hypothetical protein
MIHALGLQSGSVQAEALGRAAYETWAGERAAPFDHLPDSARLTWIRVALAAIGLALEISGAVDDLPADVAACGGLQ